MEKHDCTKEPMFSIIHDSLERILDGQERLTRTVEMVAEQGATIKALQELVGHLKKDNENLFERMRIAEVKVEPVPEIAKKVNALEIKTEGLTTKVAGIVTGALLIIGIILKAIGLA